MTEQWMTVSEAAHALGMSRTTLLAAEEAGLLTPMRTPGGHRRYRAADLTHYLQQSGSAPLAPPPPTAPDPTPPTASPSLVAALRTALRPVAQAVGADCAGVYLRDAAGALHFTAAFGIPRWLAGRLAADPTPAPVTEAASTGRPQLFDAAATAFPEPRSTGHGLTVALPPHAGALFLIHPPARELLPAELRVVDALRELLAATIEDQRRIAALEDRLARIAELTGRMQSDAPTACPVPARGSGSGRRSSPPGR
jgi:excisionase family DNA binding protein